MKIIIDIPDEWCSITKKECLSAFKDWIDFHKEYLPWTICCDQTIYNYNGKEAYVHLVRDSS